MYSTSPLCLLQSSSADDFAPPHQFLIALVVLALAVTLLRAQVYGDVPVTTRYSVFTGGFGMLVGLVGVVSLLASFVPEMVPLVLDGLAALFFLAGGIVCTFLLLLLLLIHCRPYSNRYFPF